MTFMQTLGEIRTDLAMETHQLVAGARGSSVPGVESYTEEKGRTKVTRVVIQTPEAGQALGKKPGYYVTVESPALRGRDKDELEEVAQVIAEELRTFIAGFQLSDEASGLVVGLGNWNATPDALGPKVVEKVLVTRHLWESAPPEKEAVCGRSVPYPRGSWASPESKPKRLLPGLSNGLNPISFWS